MEEEEVNFGQNKRYLKQATRQKTTTVLWTIQIKAILDMG
jgi:hypothetical protein